MQDIRPRTANVLTALIFAVGLFGAALVLNTNGPRMVVFDGPVPEITIVATPTSLPTPTPFPAATVARATEPTPTTAPPGPDSGQELLRAPTPTPAAPATEMLVEASIDGWFTEPVDSGG